MGAAAPSSGSGASSARAPEQKGKGEAKGKAQAGWVCWARKETRNAVNIINHQQISRSTAEQAR